MYKVREFHGEDRVKAQAHDLSPLLVVKLWSF